jgi:hypothetical protein
MKSKLKKDWIPRWQQVWNKLPPAKGQYKGTVREHPTPKYPPEMTNHDRMIIKKEEREARKKAEREAKKKCNFRI